MWIYGLLYKLFCEFGIKGKMWLAIKSLHMSVKAQAFYSGSLSRKFDVSPQEAQSLSIDINSTTDDCRPSCLFDLHLLLHVSI